MRVRMIRTHDLKIAACLEHSIVFAASFIYVVIHRCVHQQRSKVLFLGIVVGAALRLKMNYFGCETQRPGYVIAR